jgi:hypothetical protein
MAPDNCTPEKQVSSSTPQKTSTQEDAELIAYYEAQRNAARSNEWIACLDATLQQLRHGRAEKSIALF